MMIMNENMLNMLKELDSEFPDDYGLREGLRMTLLTLKIVMMMILILMKSY